MTKPLPSLSLQVLSGPQSGQKQTIDNYPYRIGRGDRCDFVLLDPNDPPGISREHATISWENGQWLLCDHSVNGTCINGLRLSKGSATPLHFPSEIQIGPVTRLRLARIAGTVAPADCDTVATSALETDRSLRERLTDFHTLRDAWERVAANNGSAGADRVTISEYRHLIEFRLRELQRALRKQAYEPLAPRLVAIPKRNGEVRTIAILSIQDRIVQQALQHILSPLIEPNLSNCAFAYRAGMGAHKALRAVDAGIAKGLHWIAETDVAHFFDTIQQRLLLDQLGAVVSDPFILTLLARCLAAHAVLPGTGVLQGAATSPLFSNLYLAGFDKHMSNDRRREIVRYGDDMIFLSEDRETAQASILDAQGYLASCLHLELKPEKTRVVHLSTGFSFLGFRFETNGRRATDESVVSLQQRMEHATPEQAVAILRGWRGYYDVDAADLQEDYDLTDEHDDGAPDVDVTGVPDYDDSSKRFAELFVGREDAHAIHYLRKGKLVVSPKAGPIGSEIIKEHMAGRLTCALYPLCQDGTVRLVVIDVDAAPDPAEQSPNVDPLEFARVYALGLIAACEAYGIHASCEFSGKKGYHVWLFFCEPVLVDTARKLARLIVAQTNVSRQGLTIEVFPRHSEWGGKELGDAIKLPYGVHKVTNQRSYFLYDDGAPISIPADWLETAIPISTPTVKSAIKRLEAGSSKAPSARRGSFGSSSGQVDAVFGQCAVIRGLAARPRSTGALRHTYRLILLYTLGRLGAPGAAALHRIMSQCDNYSFQRTDSYLKKMDTTQHPLTCRRIREWLEEDDRDLGLCDCEPSHQTPLDGIVTAQASKPKRPAQIASDQPKADDQWGDVCNELFANNEIDDIEEPA